MGQLFLNFHIKGATQFISEFPPKFLQISPQILLSHLVNFLYLFISGLVLSHSFIYHPIPSSHLDSYFNATHFMGDFHIQFHNLRLNLSSPHRRSDSSQGSLFPIDTTSWLFRLKTLIRYRSPFTSNKDFFQKFVQVLF